MSYLYLTRVKLSLIVFVISVYFIFFNHVMQICLTQTHVILTCFVLVKANLLEKQQTNNNKLFGIGGKCVSHQTAAGVL